MRFAASLACLLLGAAVLADCGPAQLPRINLPSGPGVPAADFAPAFTTASAACRDVRTLSAELALSGHAGTQKLRGRVLIGLAPEAIRVEAPAPGGPAFILVGNGAAGRLLLARDHRLLENASPADILSALVGVSLAPDDLRGVLSGCVKASPAPAAGRSYGSDWLAIELSGGGTAYLRRQPDWRIVTGSYNGFDIQYRFTPTGVPDRIRLISSGAGAASIDLTIALSQLEVNPDLPADRLVTLTVPPGTSPITLDELRRSGPFGQQ